MINEMLEACKNPNVCDHHRVVCSISGSSCTYKCFSRMKWAFTKWKNMQFIFQNIFQPEKKLFNKLKKRITLLEHRVTGQRQKLLRLIQIFEKGITFY